MLERILGGLMVMQIAATPVAASQPIHESLVECAVLIELLMGEQTPIPGQNAMLDTFAAAAASMRSEAERRADRAYVAQTAAKKRADWHQRWDAGDWDRPSNRGELTEWMTYCVKLGKHLRLPLDNF